jgi:hypothetical protein
MCQNKTHIHIENLIFALILIIAPTLDLCKPKLTNQKIQICIQFALKTQQIPNNEAKYHGPKHKLQKFKKKRKQYLQLPHS